MIFLLGLRNLHHLVRPFQSPSPCSDASATQKRFKQVSPLPVHTTHVHCTHTHMHPGVHMHMCTHAGTHTYTHPHSDMHMHTYSLLVLVCTFIHMCIRACICKHTCSMHTRVYQHMCTHAHSYICAYTHSPTCMDTLWDLERLMEPLRQKEASDN